MEKTKPNYDAVKYKTPTGTKLNCKGWIQEAALRMLLNNLDPAVAERPDDLIVYGGRGKAARNFEALDNIIAALKTLENDESLLIQSGKPVGILKTHKDAPRVLLSNSQLVPNWANWKHFDELEKKGLMMYGQMTAGSWIYIGSQGIVQGTYETYSAAADKHFGGTLKGTLNVTAGLGGMGGAQPLAICVSVNAVKILDRLLERNIIPDTLTDQTSAHDQLTGYWPHDNSYEEAIQLREKDPDIYIEKAYQSMKKHVELMVDLQNSG